MNFDQFENGWLSLPLPQRLIDFDNAYRYQCVDLILDGEYKMNGLGRGALWGNAIDYWNRPPAALLRVRDRIATNEVIRGDIVVCLTHGYYGDPAKDPGDGHIVYATGAINASQFEGFEQNGYDGTGRADLTDGDKIRTRWIDRARVAGVYRQKVALPANAPGVPAIGGTTVHLPASVSSWAVYRIGSALRKGTTDQVGTLDPAEFNGLTYTILGWVGDYAVNIHTEMFGDVSIWVKGTSAQFTTTAPPAATLPYSITPYSDTRNVKVKPGMHEWDLSRPSFNDIAANPLATADENTPVQPIVATLRHKDCGDNVYLLTDANVPYGWNEKDVDNYVAPPPKVPDAPLPFPAAEKFDLLVTLAGFKTAQNAKDDVNAETTVEPGPQYYVFERDEATGMVNITTAASKEGYWINPADNAESVPVTVDPPAEAEKPEEVHPPEVPATPVIADVKPAPPKVDDNWKKTFSFFNTDRTPVIYLTINAQPYDVYNLGNGELLGSLEPDRQLHIVGTFTKDGRLYGLTYEAWLQGGWPNVPMKFLKFDRFGNFLNTIGDVKKRIEGIFK
jgi:hypothetical protein